MTVTYFITGASRGIGLELVNQLTAVPSNKVIAAVRNPKTSSQLVELQKKIPSERLSVVELDVSDLNAVKAIPSRVATLLPNGLDVLILNAGISNQHFTNMESADPKVLQDELLINTVSPMATLQAFLPLLRQGHEKKVLFLSSIVASLALSERFNAWGDTYSITKTALNMVIKKFGTQLRPEGITLIPIHPGWVKTELGQDGATLEVEDSVTGVIKVLNAASIETSMKFVDYKGSELLW